MKTIITVWQDGDQWIVSRDRVDDEYGPGNNTGSHNSVTLGVVESEMEALGLAAQHAAESGNLIFSQDKHGIPSLI